MSLNASENRVARAVAKAKANEAPPLNPDFPYKRRSFDLHHFGVDKEAPVPARKG